MLRCINQIWLHATPGRTIVGAVNSPACIGVGCPSEARASDLNRVAWPGCIVLSCPSLFLRGSPGDSVRRETQKTEEDKDLT